MEKIKIIQDMENKEELGSNIENKFIIIKVFSDLVSCKIFYRTFF